METITLLLVLLIIYLVFSKRKDSKVKEQIIRNPQNYQSHSKGNSIKQKTTEGTLDKVELIKAHIAVTSQQAKEALERNDGNVIDALIDIEESLTLQKEPKTLKKINKPNAKAESGLVIQKVDIKEDVKEDLSFQSNPKDLLEDSKVISGLDERNMIVQRYESRNSQFREAVPKNDMYYLNTLINKSNDMYRDGDFGSDSIEVNKKIIDLDKNNINAYRRLAQCYSRRNDDLQRYLIYKELLTIYPNYDEAQKFVELYEIREAKNRKIKLGRLEHVEYGGPQYIDSNIKSYLIERKITSLFHFTDISNLNSINDNNLLPIEDLYNKNINVKITDGNRLEGHKDCICLSLSYPNTSMMWSKCYKSDYSFALLKIDPKVLYETRNIDKYYFPSNAVHFRNKSTNYFTGLSALNRLFGLESIRSLNELENCYTTDPQAEVLFKGAIDKKYIRKIIIQQKNVFKTQEMKSDYFKSLVFINDNYFEKRKDSEFWKGGRYYDGEKILQG